MNPLIKINLQELLNQAQPVAVELGCGQNKMPGCIGIDIIDLPEVDIVADLECGLPFFPDNSVDAFYAFHFLEHIDHLAELMRDIHRALKPDGRLILRVPHFSNPFFYSDFTHKRFFGLYSFDYFSRSPRFKRRLPRNYVDFSFRTQELKLIFYSDRLPIKICRRVVQHIVNSSCTLQEIYEELWSRWIPCSEIYAVLTPEK